MPEVVFFVLSMTWVREQVLVAFHRFYCNLKPRQLTETVQKLEDIASIQSPTANQLLSQLKRIQDELKQFPNK